MVTWGIILTEGYLQSEGILQEEMWETNGYYTVRDLILISYYFILLCSSPDFPCLLHFYLLFLGVQVMKLRQCDKSYLIVLISSEKLLKRCYISLWFVCWFFFLYCFQFLPSLFSTPLVEFYMFWWNLKLQDIALWGPLTKRGSLTHTLYGIWFGMI